MSIKNLPVIFYRRSKHIWLEFVVMALVILWYMYYANWHIEKTVVIYAGFSAFLHLFAGFLAGKIIYNSMLIFKEFDKLKCLYQESLSKCLEFVYSTDILIFILVMLLLILSNLSLRLSVQKGTCQSPLVLLINTIMSFVYCCCYADSSPELHELCEKHKLNIGYGAAMFYYHNYLKHYIPRTFLERIRRFSSAHQVTVQEKLIILIPQSCITKRNLDENPRIERARELPTFLLDIAGIKNRVYNITVYQIFKGNEGSNDDLSEDSVWQAVEYAQPLHDFYDLKCKGKITENEMYQERKIFIQTLRELLCDADNSSETVTLLPYDDIGVKLDEAQLILNNILM